MQEGADAPAAVSPAPSTESSRTSKQAAGWLGPSKKVYGTRWEQLLKRRRRTFWGNFTWISRGPRLASINDRVAKGLDDVVNDRRARWVAAARGEDWSDEALTIASHAEKQDLSFLVIGDPGEQDASQYATVAPLLAVGADSDFAIVASDVIYPAGDINDYIDGFYLPFQDYEPPIYALPGNHDWYDGLNGFMFHFCGVEALAPVAYRSGAYTFRERLARVLWRNPSPPDVAELVRERASRAPAGESWRPPQPAPYYTIDTPDLRVVCIDTGITGVLDREQGDWLRRVSRDRRDKVLITGKPIYVDGEYHPGKIDWGVPKDGEPGPGETDTIDTIVRDPDNPYVAAIGGDVHNYQHYPVDVDGRRIHYVVSGGGGAYLSATHRFGRVDMAPGKTPDLPAGTAPILEEDVTLYPLRGDSLARFVSRFSGLLRYLLPVALLLGAVAIAVLLIDQHGLADRIGVLAADGADRTADGAGPQRWAAILVGFLSVALVGGIGYASVRASRLFARGYRTLAATTLTVAIVSLVVYVTVALTGDAWHWIWRMAAGTGLALLVPAGFLVLYYLLRDFIPPSVRAGIALLPALAVGILALERAVGGETGAAALIVAVALLTLWLAVGWVGELRAKGAQPGEQRGRLRRTLVGDFHADPDLESEHKKRRRFGQALPPALGAAGIVALLVLLPNDNPTAWIPTAILWIWIALIALVAIALFWIARGAFPQFWWLYSPNVDPDEVARWIADQLGCEPVRDSAKTVVASPKTERLAALTRDIYPIRKFMSELAEATRPPFFKSFLRVDLEGETLAITCYGVSGHLEHEQAPAVEQRIEIPVRRAAT
jgi:hypothetical protein